MTDTERSLAQLRTETLNARECEDGYVEVRTADLEAALAEVQRLNDELDARESSSDLAATREIDLRADRDALEAKLDSALSTVTALTQTIRAMPDAVANDAANLAHARAGRDRLVVERNQALSDLVGANEQLDHLAGRVAEVSGERDEARKVAAALLHGIELHVGFDAIKTLNVSELPAWTTPWLAAERYARARTAAEEATS
jgi:hypothetical protein